MSKRIASPGLWSLAACVGLSTVFLASCTGNRAPQQQPVASSGISGPYDYSRPHRDGAPWWDVDVSRIPDAVPMPHTSALAWNRSAPDGRRWSLIGQEQVDLVVRVARDVFSAKMKNTLSG